MKQGARIRRHARHPRFQSLVTGNLMRLGMLIVLCLLYSASAIAEFRLIPIEKPQPDYPQRMLMTNRAGAVSVEFTVRNDGTVSRVKITGSTHSGFEPGVVEAVSRWRFQPWRVTLKAPRKVQATNLLIFSPIPDSPEPDGAQHE